MAIERKATVATQPYRGHIKATATAIWVESPVETGDALDQGHH